jgi:hypothetical protein
MCWVATCISRQHGHVSGIACSAAAHAAAAAAAAEASIAARESTLMMHSSVVLLNQRSVCILVLPPSRTAPGTSAAHITHVSVTLKSDGVRSWPPKTKIYVKL